MNNLTGEKFNFLACICWGLIFLFFWFLSRLIVEPFHSYAVYTVFLFFSTFLPDLYIIPNRNKWMNFIQKSSKVSLENNSLFPIPQIAGRIERFLYYIFLLFLPEQFVIFLGIWLALKTVVTYKNWEGDDGQESHGARAKFNLFLIGNGLSIASVIVFFFMAKFIVNH